MSRDKYLQKNYGITEAEYNRMLVKQDGACKICGRRPRTDGPRLHVDHCHAIPKTKIEARKRNDGLPPKSHSWFANTLNPPAQYPKLYFQAYGATKREAVQAVRKLLLRASVRGLLCWHSNALLAKGRDNPEVFIAAANYLNEFNAKYR